MKGKNIVGSAVKQARENFNPKLTQEALSSKLQLLGIDLDRSAISKLESGKRPVYDYEVYALAEALNVSCEWLKAGDTKPR